MSVDPLPQLKDATANLNPADKEDLPSDGSSVDSMVVGVAPLDPGTQDTGVGSPGLGATADSDGTADIPGAKPHPPLGSSGAAAADSIAVGVNATSTTLGGQPVTTTVSGDGPIAATSNASGTLGPLLPDIALVGGPGSGPGPGARHEITTFSGSGIQFSNTFEASVSAAFQANILTAEQDIHNLWTDSATITLDFNEIAEGMTGDLASNSFFLTGVTYSQLKTALQAQIRPTVRSAWPPTIRCPRPTRHGGVTYFLPINYADFLGLDLNDVDRHCHAEQQLQLELRPGCRQHDDTRDQRGRHGPCRWSRRRSGRSI